jgi:hypothetical protein
MWVTNTGSATVTRITAFSSTTSTDGTVTQYSATNYPVRAQPTGIAFDGANMWVTNSGGSSVTKIQAGNGVVVGTYSAPGSPQGIAFDGANMWVMNKQISTSTCNCLTKY